MSRTEEDERVIDRTVRSWRQGDVSLDAGLEFLHITDLSRPHSPACVQVAEALVNGGEAIDAGATPVLDEVRNWRCSARLAMPYEAVAPGHSSRPCP